MPTFYDRDESGLAQRWLQMIRTSLCALGPDVQRHADAGAVRRRPLSRLTGMTRSWGA
jgi:hypothetical protein